MMRSLPKFTKAKIVGLSTVRGYRLHRDIKSFANRLIAIVPRNLVQPQQGTGKANLLGVCTLESEDFASMPSSEADSCAPSLFSGRSKFR